MWGPKRCIANIILSIVVVDQHKRSDFGVNWEECGNICGGDDHGGPVELCGGDVTKWGWEVEGVDVGFWGVTIFLQFSSANISMWRGGGIC